jgi:hypothetical protein
MEPSTNFHSSTEHVYHSPASVTRSLHFRGTAKCVKKSFTSQNAAMRTLAIDALNKTFSGVRSEPYFQLEGMGADSKQGPRIGSTEHRLLKETIVVLVQWKTSCSMSCHASDLPRDRKYVKHIHPERILEASGNQILGFLLAFFIIIILVMSLFV